ncbi:hypothetical protein A2U01_0094810, partial [Trifolium medium]|nr:hypothetical protein [Trifolium medium]
GVRDVVGDVRRTVARGFGLRLGGARNGEIGKRVAAWFRGMGEMELGRVKTCGGGREEWSSNSGGHGNGIKPYLD